MAGTISGQAEAVCIISTFFLRKLFHVAHDLGVLLAHVICLPAVVTLSSFIFPAADPGWVVASILGLDRDARLVPPIPPKVPLIPWRFALPRIRPQRISFHPWS